MRALEELQKMTTFEEFQNVTNEERELMNNYLKEKQLEEQQLYENYRNEKNKKLKKLISEEDFNEYLRRQKIYEESIAGHYEQHDTEWEMYCAELYTKYDLV